MFAVGNTLGICLLRCIIVTMVLIQWGHASDIPREPRRKICDTAECGDAANMFLQNMDQTVNPCENFYAYACGNWEVHNPIPIYAHEWTIHSIMRTNTQAKLKELLLTILRRTKTGETYQMCLDQPSLKKSKPSVITSYVMDSKYWPMILNKKKVKSLYQPWWTIDNYYVKLTGESAFFSTHLMPSIKQGSLPMQSLYELISPYGSIIRFQKWDRESVINYKTFLVKLVETVSPVEIQKVALWVDIHKVLQFRNKLEEIMEFGENDKLYSRDAKSIRQLQRWHDKLAKKSRMINWLEIIRSLYGPLYYSKIKEDTMVNVARKKYFIMLTELLKNESEETIVNHIHLYFMEKYMELDSRLKAMLLKATLQNFEPAARIRRTSERWKSCLDKMGFDFDLSTAYVDAVFKPKKIKGKVEQLFMDLKNIIKMQISESTWLDSTTKDKSVVKVAKAKIWSGYPKWYDDFSLRERYRDIEMDPTTINAFLKLDRNLVLINAAILQYPIYSKELPNVMNYASTGSLIAHELYHAFGDLGVYYNAAGRYSKTYWSSDMLKLYDERKQCFIDQYNSYDITELGKTKDALKCQGQLTYEENIADTMGLKTAFALYTKKKIIDDGGCDVLPGLEKFSCDQFFFLSFANSLCSVISKDFLRYYLKQSRHALPRLRINGAVSNLEEFSAAYKCGPETPMNRTTKCDLWK